MARTGFLAIVDLETVTAALAPRLLAYALGRTGCRSTAEDVAQEALTALVRRWHQVGPPESAEAFVFAIARRRANRANARRALMAPLEALTELAGRGSTPADAEQRYGDREELALVLGAIRQLRRADREVLLLRLAGGLSVEQVAALTRSTPAAIKMRLHRARHRLLALLPEGRHGIRRQSA